MSPRNSYYNNRTATNRDLIPSSSEPDMRTEMIHTLYGSSPEIAKGQTIAIRKMRRDSSNNLIKCPCSDTVTKEADLSNWCFSCAGEGYLWDESFFVAYKQVLKSDVGNSFREKSKPHGLMNIASVAFYTSYNSVFTEDDKIVELVLTNNGAPKLPYEREAIYTISTAFDYRADNGKLEYWKLDCYKELRKFLNGP